MQRSDCSRRFGFAFIPVDVVWHQVIGPDLTAASPPQVVGAVSGSAVALGGVALVLSTTVRTTWQPLVDRPRSVDAVTLGILALLALNWLQLLTTEWDWGNQIAESRPAWVYPVIVGVVGTAFSQVALHATRRVGAATALALVNVALHAVAVIAFRLYLPPGPSIAAHVLLVPAAVALDVWYARQMLRTAPRPPALPTELIVAVVYAIVLLATVFPYAAWFMSVPVFDLLSVLGSVGTAVPAVVVSSLVFARLGAWIGSPGRSQIAPRDVSRQAEMSMAARAVPGELATEVEAT